MASMIGAVLDRNGLRPSRYYVTKDDLVIMASEAGVLDVPPEEVVQKGRLQPGRMFLVDTEQGRIIDDEEIKASVAGQVAVSPLARRVPRASEGSAAPHPRCRRPIPARSSSGRSLSATRSRISARCSSPWRRTASRPWAPWATTRRSRRSRRKPRMLYDYFKQLFAQVTNPPIDCIREELITASEVWLGSEGNLLRPQPGDCRRLELQGADSHERRVRARSGA